MRALLIVDRLFAQHERAMLQRTAIGLLDEGIETTMVVPDLGTFDTTGVGALIPQVKYKDRGLSFTLKIRAASIIRDLSDDRSDVQWDIVHGFGGNCWSLANEIAKSLDSAMVLELWRAGLIPRASQLYKQVSVECMFTAPDKSIERAVHEINPRLPVQVAPWGSPAPTTPREILQRDRGISIVMQSSGRNREECTAAFEGVLDAIRNQDNIHLFVNLHAAQRSALWSKAKKAGALGQLTLVDQIEEQRDLVLNADYLIYPDTVHEHRSLLFEAMGSAMCVLASTAEQSSCLIDGKTALIVNQPTRAGWSESLRSLLSDQERSRELGHNAWKHIREQRKVSTHIGALIDIYSQLIPLETGTRAVR